MYIRFVSISSTEPLTLAQAKTHLGIITTGAHDHDTYITALIIAARERAETYTGRSLVPKTIEVNLTELPPSRSLKLPGEPIKEITKFSYLDPDGNWVHITPPANPVDPLQTEVIDDYLILEDNILLFEKIFSLNNVPSLTKIKVQYTTGYGDVGSYKRPFPESIKQAMLIMIRTMYDNRDDVIRGTIVSLMPRGSEYLLNHYRTFEFK